MMARYIERVTKHDPSYNDGSMCRGLFSTILYDLQDFVFSLQPENSEDDKEIERLTKIIVRQKLEEVANEIGEIHDNWINPSETGPDALRAKDHSQDWKEWGRDSKPQTEEEWPTQVEEENDDNGQG